MREGDGMTDRQEIERPQIDGEALTGIGVSATTQEAPQRASGDPGARVDGSGADDSLTEWDVTVTMVRTIDGRKDTRDFTMRVPAVGTSGAESAARGIGDAINEGSGYAWKFASDDAIRVRCVRGRAVVPADGLVKVGSWPVIADAGTAEFDRLWAELENAPAPPTSRVEWGAAHGTCEHWGSWPTEDALTTWLVDNPDWRPIQRTVSVVTPLPPASAETREHPGAGQPTEPEPVGALPVVAGSDAEASCQVNVWGGPYRACGWTLVNGRCGRHG